MPSATSKYQGLARNVENVLNHRRSLDAFRQWMLDEPGGGHAPQALDLYFAIKSYKDSVENRNPQAKLIARQLHIKFIRSLFCLGQFIILVFAYDNNEVGNF